jgi:hypothetical protein
MELEDRVQHDERSFDHRYPSHNLGSMVHVNVRSIKKKSFSGASSANRRSCVPRSAHLAPTDDTEGGDCGDTAASRTRQPVIDALRRPEIKPG